MASGQSDCLLEAQNPSRGIPAGKVRVTAAFLTSQQKSHSVTPASPYLGSKEVISPPGLKERGYRLYLPEERVLRSQHRMAGETGGIVQTSLESAICHTQHVAKPGFELDAFDSKTSATAFQPGPRGPLPSSAPL